MKKTIKDSLRHLPCIVATLFLLAAAACMPESFKPGIDTPGSRDRSPMTLELGISSPESSIRTRADESGPMGDSTINSIWIGVFDIETGDLVGQTASNRTQGETEKYPFRTAKVDILYYDAHPQVRIFGVANYIGVNARRTGTDYPSCNTPLGTLLNDVENITDFLDISVEAKEPGNSAPLMMGVYTNSDVSGRYAVDITDSQQLHNFDKETDIALNELHDPKNKTGKYNRIDYAYMNGQIRLRRLVSQINVTVVPGQSSDKTVELSNMSYRRVNLPKEVYLQERQTKGFESSWNATEWGKQTPNKADVLVDYVTGNSALGYESDTDFKAFNNSFTFYQYENKHWGTAANQSAREEVRKGKDFAGNPVFTALCGENEEGTIYNNYASYFEINVDVAVTENGSTQNANVTYRIHEGFCNDINGKEVDVNDFEDLEDYYAEIAPDFTCVRNTLYNYTITIKGLNSLNVSVNGEHSSHPGIEGGSVLLTEKETLSVPGDQTTELPETDVVGYICYYENGGDPQAYAGGNYETLFSIPSIPDNIEQIIENTKMEDAAKFGFIIGSNDISQLFETLATRATEDDSKAISGRIQVTSPVKEDDPSINPRKHFQSLYLLHKPFVAEDDECMTYGYSYVYYQPVDTRKPIGGEVTFDLAFENDNGAAISNDALVAGHIKGIYVQNIKLTDIIDGVVPVYTILLDEKEICSGSADEIAATNLYEKVNPASYSGNSLHTVQLIASAKDSGSDVESEKETFVVYPTTFEWDYNDSTWEGEEITLANGSKFYGSYTELGDYYALQHQNELTVKNKGTNGTYYLQVGTEGRTGDALKIRALYDGVLRIKCSNTSNSADPTRALTITNSNSSEQVYAAVSAGNPTGSEAKEYSFYIQKGEVVLSIDAGFNIYSIELTYLYNPTACNRTWDFSDSKWSNLLSYYPKNTDITNLSAVFEGLHLETQDNPVRIKDVGNSTVIDLRGKGDLEKRNRLFWFDAYKSGTVTITAAAAGYDASKTPADHRYLAIKVGETPSESLSILPTTTEKTNQIYSFKISEPTRVYITSGNGGINVYSIKFEESK